MNLTFPEEVILLINGFESLENIKNSIISVAALLELFETGWIGYSVPNNHIRLFKRHTHPNRVLNRLVYLIRKDVYKTVSEWFYFIDVYSFFFKVETIFTFKFS
jgi:hypothetical protein